MVSGKKLEDLTQRELGKLFPINVVPYDRNWIGIFNAEKEILKETLGEKVALRVEHFGSTAIEGLAAKPTIDILVEIPTLTDELREQIIRKLSALDYQFIWRTDETIPYMHFVKGYTINGFNGNVFHIHMGERTHPLWDRIYFRNYLRNNRTVAKEYETLKITLAKKHPFDREAYTKGKEEFVKRITDIAKKENGSR